MSELKFTPGPWRWVGFYLLQDCPCPYIANSEHGESCSVCTKGRTTNPYSTPAGYPIADDGSAGGEYNSTIDVNGPDARLIAAAPELYELLDEIATWDYCDDGGWFTAQFQDRARAILAKARGKSA